MYKLLDKLEISASAAEKSVEKTVEEYIPVELSTAELTDEIIDKFANTAYLFEQLYHMGFQNEIIM